MKKRFRIRFSGRKYPAYRPISVTLLALDEADAAAQAIKQMEAWGIPSPKMVTLKIEAAGDAPPSKDDGKGADGKKKGKRRPRR